MSQAPGGLGDTLRNLEWQQPPPFMPDGIVSTGAGEVGIGFVTFLFGVVGDYLLDFWPVLLPFFIALSLMWLILSYFGVRSARLEDSDAMLESQRILWAQSSGRQADGSFSRR